MIAVLMIITVTSGAFGQVLPPPSNVISTIPPNGDVNPYGIAIALLHVPAGLILQHDDVLVSNFNNTRTFPASEPPSCASNSADFIVHHVHPPFFRSKASLY